MPARPSKRVALLPHPKLAQLRELVAVPDTQSPLNGTVQGTEVRSAGAVDETVPSEDVDGEAVFV